MLQAVEERIKRWKNKLIDLSKRNRLLNFKPTKVTTVRIIDEIPSEIYRTIVLDEKSMTFQFIEEEDSVDNEDPQPIKDFKSEEFSNYSKEELDKKHIDLYLQTNLVEKQLDKNLFRIASISSSVMEEQGYNSLFLALGFLEWFESKDSDIKFKSPILLIPVHLNRTSVKSSYKLSFGDDTPILNPALMHKLSLDFGIKLDDVSEELEQIEPQDVFLKVKEAVKDFERWRVTNDIFLGLFSFSKFIMFKDLEKNATKLSENEVVQTICGVEKERISSLDDICPLDEIERNTKPERTFQILDADSSQQRAILVVKKGHNLVIEGPPGTGKSQTIANMIAESLTEGKKVLFVSEKMAALEVVKARLEESGIGDYCLELHSRKTNKKKVAEELGKVMQQGKKADHTHYDELIKLERLREELNHYVNELHKPYGELQMTPYQAIGIVNANESVPDLAYIFNEAKTWTKEKLHTLTELIDKFGRNLSNFEQPNEHPWFGTRITELTYFDKTHLNKHIEQIKKISAELTAQSDSLGKICSYQNIKTLADIQELLDASEVLKMSPNVASNLLKDRRWNDISADVQQIINTVKTFNNLEEKYQKVYRMTVLDEDLENILNRYRQYEKKSLRVLNPKFWKDKRTVQKHFVKKRKLSVQKFIKELEELLEAKKAAIQIDTFECGQQLFAERWKGKKSNGLELEKFANWLVRFRSHVIKKHFSDEVFEISQDKEVLEQLQNKVKHSLNQFNEVFQSINHTVKFKHELAFGDEDFEKNALQVIIEKINKMQESVEGIDPWLSFQRVYQECEEQKLIDFIGVLYNKNIVPNTYAVTFKCQFLRCWLDEAFSERQKLRNFAGKNHEQLIEQFKELDSMQIELAKIKIQHILSGNYDSSWQGSSGSERGLLEREVRKKRAHKPLRKLFKEIPNLLLSLKPCLMMSPLSVAQFLSPELFEFDLVIFDEASQVPPQDSIGAIMRGKQIVVAGDTKQLPPTSFFQSTVLDTEDEDNEFDEYIPEDLDSILDECASVGFPRTLLEWHYRSKHESLIAFSNKFYYENRLNTFPNSEDVSDSLGIKFNYYPETQYRKGGVNVLEAEEVARKVFHHFKENPKITLGVGTFSIKQKYAIEDAIEELRKKDTSLEELFSTDRPEHFFVKNLESIQGDERDIIFISIGYGKEASGKLPMRFGPINQLGGERRLNVLVTRARRRLEIFTSIRGSDFDLNRTESEGVHLLKKYLDYAELGREVILQDIEFSSSASFSESPFEESVYEILSKSGFKVHQQVGCSGYRIDMAIVDSNSPGKYILGIECDGAAYHSSLTARDRDRLRQQVLEGLGWDIYRIWSTDWFKNRKKEAEKLVIAVKKFQEGSVKKKLKNQSDFEIKLDELSTRVESSNNGKLITYRITPIDALKTSDFYYQSNSVLSQVLLKIVEYEGPIHYEEAWHRLIQHWGIRSIGSRIRQELKNLERYCVSNKKIEKKKDFYWSNKKQDLKIRNRDIDGLSKKIEYVSPEEIQEAIIHSLTMDFSMPIESLIPQSAKLLGFKRIGEDVHKAVKNNIATLTKEKKIIQENGTIKISRQQ